MRGSIFDSAAQSREMGIQTHLPLDYGELPLPPGGLDAVDMIRRILRLDLGLGPIEILPAALPTLVFSIILGSFAPCSVKGSEDTGFFPLLSSSSANFFSKYTTAGFLWRPLKFSSIIRRKTMYKYILD